MFDSTVLESITQAASNSLVIFCFCNLIIVMILVGSKPISSFDEEGEIPRSMVPNAYRNMKEDSGNIVVSKPSLDENKKSTTTSFEGNSIAADDSSRVSITLEEPADDLPADDDDEDDDEENGNDKGDDEFRRRVEEFIDKVNRERRAELLRQHV